MMAYIVEYRYYDDKIANQWISKTSSEGYKTLEAAQAFIEGRANEPARITATYYQTTQFEEYYIHPISIV